MTSREGLFWSSLWFASAIALVNPGLTMSLARTLGIGRGADLVFYSAILAAGVAFFFTFLRLRRIEGQLTELVRHIALDEARGGSRPPTEAAGAASPPEPDEPRGGAHADER
jgi:hypothetical protein